MKANYYKHILNFKVPSGTSRGILKTKETWYITITKDDKKGWNYSLVSKKVFNKKASNLNLDAFYFFRNQLKLIAF